ncbi:MAG: septum formation initiator family protein [Breznakia sp.]
MTKTKQKRKNKLPRYFLMLVMLGLSIFFSFQIIQRIQTNSKLKASIKETEAVLKELKTEKQHLQTKKSHLENDEYLQRIARGKFMYTKDDGEQVFKLPSKEE